MKHQEKKYQINSFNHVIGVLKRLGALKKSGKVTHHYYGQSDGNDVTKLVKYQDKCEIHILKETDGKFDLTDNIPVKDIKDGLKWLKTNGFKAVDIIKMENIDYEYNGGLVRLYTIDDWLKSVILDYPKGKHEKIAEKLGLVSNDQIKVPYNKHLASLGKLRSREVN